MDLFGLKGHEEQHETTERMLRRLVEQVGQLSSDLGQTRMEVRRLSLVVDGKVDASDVDPLLAASNQTLDRARSQLADLIAAADEQRDGASDRFNASVEALRVEADRIIAAAEDGAQ